MKTSTRRTTLLLVAVAALGLVALGAAAARIATRPLDITLTSHIEIHQQVDGRWQKVDEVGPENLTFSASLAELANQKKVRTTFQWRTQSKKGKPYSVRLVGDADTRFNPMNGKFDADLSYEISYDGETAIVPAKVTTGGRSNPVRALSGRPAQGVFGVEKSSFTLVSANSFRPAGGTEYLFVCREQYTMTPRRGR